MKDPSTKQPNQMLELIPNRPWWHLELKEIWQRRYLCRLLIRKDVLASHKQSVFGPAWFVIQPIVTSILFAVFFGLFAGLTPRDTPRFLYYLSANVPWSFFQAVTLGVAGCLVANAPVMGKVYFPRLIAPLVATGVALIHFSLNYVVFVVVFLIYHLGRDLDMPLNIWRLPLAAILIANVGILGFGTGLLCASFGVRYRDLRIALPILLQTWMFMTPIIYPSSVVPDAWRPLFFLNPMAGIIEAHRHVFLGTPMPPILYLLQGGAVAFLICISGLFIFNRTQRTFIDII